MRSGLARFLPVLIMACLAAATFWMEQLVQPEAVAPPRQARHTVDFTAEGFRLVQMNREGFADTVLAAERGVHYADDGVTELTAPRLLRQRPGQPGIEVKARQGRVDRDAEVVELVGAVEATRAASADTPALRIETTTLTVSLPDETADTSAPVRVTRGDSVLEGTGMHVDNHSRTLDLAANVHAVLINPRSAPPAGPGSRR